MSKLHGTASKVVITGLTALLLSACGGARADQPIASKGELGAGDAIPAPKAKPILTVSGLISKSNSGDEILLDLETLEDMPLVEATVYEPFLKKDVTFTGVMMDDFLPFVGADVDAEGVHMVALDDYQVELPMDELTSSTVMLATRQDGRRIKLKAGGPSRIIFLNDEGMGSNTDMWIWSVTSMQVQN